MTGEQLSEFHAAVSEQRAALLIILEEQHKGADISVALAEMIKGIDDLLLEISAEPTALRVLITGQRGMLAKLAADPSMFVVPAVLAATITVADDVLSALEARIAVALKAKM